MTTAHINIGSNLGHRGANISSAVCLLGERVGRVSALSSPVESKAWGYDSNNLFINLGVNVETELDAPAIVTLLKQIEREIDSGGAGHRTPSGAYADRIIDLDLIALGSGVCDAPGAIVPHPRMHLREFVLVPMQEICPGWVHPRLGENIAQMLAALRNNGGCACVNTIEDISNQSLV